VLFAPAATQSRGRSNADAELALLVALAFDVAASAILSIDEDFDALSFAPRLAGGAVHDARAIVARYVGALRGDTLRLATPAMLRITGQIQAFSVAVGVATNAREIALTRVALAGGEGRGLANLTTPAAVIDVAVGVDARTVAVRGARRALSFASAS